MVTVLEVKRRPLSLGAALFKKVLPRAPTSHPALAPDGGCRLLSHPLTLELWRWRRLLRVPWTARRPNQEILKQINPEYSLEALMLKLKLQYFGHLM